MLHPLNNFLCKNARWQCFKQAKEALVSSKVLVHYNPSLPLKLAGDASAYGVGAVISHVMEDGSERPITFASRTLTSSERNYAQVEKEALSLVFGVKKFHTYLYGWKFTITTDHKPLTTILGPKQGVPTLAAARLQRWALVLSAYTYNIEFCPTDRHGNADGLSRLPLTEVQMEGVWKEPSIFNIHQIGSLPVTPDQLRAATRTDATLSKVLLYTRKGWPQQVNDTLFPYWKRRYELTVEQDCILWGIRVVVPMKLHEKLLAELHSNHPGASRMKAVARGYFWWPGLDEDIQRLAKECQTCVAVKHTPTTVPMHPWEWPPQPWQRVHLDYAGPFQGTNFLVAMDAHSKWPEVEIMPSTTAVRTIEVLQTMFARNGIPEQIVTDNSPQFVSEEFQMFLRENGVKHTRIAPYHPASNGLAEQFVQSLKIGLKTNLSARQSLPSRLANFLLTYRSSPHATTGTAPCSLFLHRPLRTCLDLLLPNQEGRVTLKQSQQKAAHDRKAIFKEFFVGQSIMARNLRPGADWVPATIVERTGPVSYLVETGEHQMWRRHADQLKDLSGVIPKTPSSSSSSNSSTDDNGDDFDISNTARDGGGANLNDQENMGNSPSSSQPDVAQSSQPDAVQPSQDRRYPQRTHVPPDRYGQ